MYQEEKLKKIRHLSEKIEKIESKLINWNQATSIHSAYIDCTTSPHNSILVEISGLNFKVLKTISVATLQEELDILKDELDKLLL